MHRVDPLREGSGESVTSQGIGRMLRAEVPTIFLKKSIHISGLAIRLSHFHYRKCQLTSRLTAFTPSVFRTLNCSYSSLRPNAPKRAWAPPPQAKSVP